MKNKFELSNRTHLVGNLNLIENDNKPAKNELQNQITATAIHIDTVRLRHSLSQRDVPSDEFLRENGFQVNERVDRNGFKVRNSIYKPRKKNKTPLIHIISSESGYCHISITCSIAKLINTTGIDLQSDDDIAFALNKITKLVYEMTKIRFDAANAIVSRLDVNADFSVKDGYIRHYVNSAQQPNATLKPAKFGETTISFANKSRKIEIYGKYQQMAQLYREGKLSPEAVEASKGLLRFEVSYKKPAAFKTLKITFKKELLAKNLLKISVAEDILRKNLSLLTLNKCKPSNAHLVELLLTTFGKDAPRMYGFLYFRKIYGEDVWKHLGCSKSTYNRVKRNLAKANLLSNLQDVPLPALVIK